MRRFIIFLSVSLAYTCFPQITFAADVVINEYLPNPEGSGETSEWIELFNNTENEIDLAGWKIDDVAGGGSSPFAIPSGSLISSKGFFVLERSVTGIILNNDSDTIRLLNSLDEVIDEYKYNATEENIFYGRKIDGGLEWVGFSSSTKNSSNNAGSVILTPTLTPEPTSEPTNTPSPTKVPTITKAPTLTPLPTYTKVPTKKVTPTVKKSPTPKSASPTKIIEEKVLGETSDKKPTDSVEPMEEVKVKGSSMVNPGTVLIALGGIFLLACGILLFYMKKKAQNTP